MTLKEILQYHCRVKVISKQESQSTVMRNYIHAYSIFYGVLRIFTTTITAGSVQYSTHQSNLSEIFHEQRTFSATNSQYCALHFLPLLEVKSSHLFVRSIKTLIK